MDTHNKGECPNIDCCWNCEGEHFWKSCPTPLLTKAQRELKSYGYIFKHGIEKTKVFYKEKDADASREEKNEMRVMSRKEAVEKICDFLLRKIPKYKGTYLVGYNIFMILAVLVDMADSCDMKKSAEIWFKNLSGIIDIKWLFPKSQGSLSLEACCTALGLKSMAKKFIKQSAILQSVDRAIIQVDWLLKSF